LIYLLRIKITRNNTGNTPIIITAKSQPLKNANNNPEAHIANDK
jgi:hypothetical protein